MLAVMCAVVVFCHSKTHIMAQFLFRAQDLNMTNGDFAFFTFRAMRSSITDRPWDYYVANKADLPRRKLAFYAVKQVPVDLPRSPISSSLFPCTDYRINAGCKCNSTDEKHLLTSVLRLCPKSANKKGFGG